jgi:maltose phosphorylase
MIDYIKENEWSIIEDGFDPKRIMASESIFSTGNGKFGQRANFEEDYSGEHLYGNYISGIYYPDRTKVGWWKKGYPNYFAKTVNCPVWNALQIEVNGENLDLSQCKEVLQFSRELNMKEGWYQRIAILELQNGIQLQIDSKRFISMAMEQLGAVRYSITLLNHAANLKVAPHLKLDTSNRDSNWNEPFTQAISSSIEGRQIFHESEVLKTGFHICAFNSSQLTLNGKTIEFEGKESINQSWAGISHEVAMKTNDCLSITTFGGYINSMDTPDENLKSKAQDAIRKAEKKGFDTLLKKQKIEWELIWRHSDIKIEGDISAQQAIRFNIFHLNQTYTGKDARLNVGPKGFTGEKYGGVTYWDTEAYCLPFYMGTKDKSVPKNLLRYRYQQLDKAIENAEKLGFSAGAALYPMVTANGEECHNEWEITFEEIHRNSAIALAIKKYIDFTDDQSHMAEMGLEVLIGISRFWAQRVSFSSALNKYVILGVTGPNEYENNVDNNWYTNYSARWCLKYTKQAIESLALNDPENHQRICQITNFKPQEIQQWNKIIEDMYLPYSKELDIYIQHDGFLNKELIPAAQIPKDQRPINQHWSWDRILRSPYIKQADVLQGFYFFEDDFSLDDLKKHYAFYETYTVHESSLSPCIHCIESVRLGCLDQAHSYFLQTARLDLNDYNKEVHEGLHVTSMAGAWMSLIEGFAGVKIKNGLLNLAPKISDQWTSYSFHLNYRDCLIFVEVTHEKTNIQLIEGEEVKIILNDEPHQLSNQKINIIEY